MGAIVLPKILVPTYQTTRRHFPEEQNTNFNWKSKYTDSVTYRSPNSVCN